MEVINDSQSQSEIGLLPKNAIVLRTRKIPSFC